MPEPITVAFATFALKPLVEGIVTSLKSTVHEATRKAWQAINADAVEDTYRRNIIRDLGRTKILGKSHEIDLDQVYTDVRVSKYPIHESYLEICDDDSEGDAAFQRLLARAKVDRHKVDEFLTFDTRLYVLGTPGAGKTTLMRHIAIQAARGVIARLPIYVPLRDLVALQTSVRSYLTKTLSIGGIPEPELLLDKLLEAGSAMLLFDGLDELPQAGNFRQRLLQEMLDIARQHPKSQVIISCRIAASDRSLENFKYLYIAEFSTEQQDKFLERWFFPDTNKLESFRTQWDKPSNKPIRGLASSPLLLTLVCLAYNSTGAFPRKKIDLFRDAVDALVYHWDTDRGIAREGQIADLLEPRRKDHLVQSIAFHTFLDDHYAFSEAQGVRELQRYFDTLPSSFENRPKANAGMLKELAANHGIILERAVRWYSFSHLSIHEYLVARYLNESANTEETESALTRPRLMDPRWREVLLTLVTMRANASSEIGKMLDTCCRRPKTDPLIEVMPIQN